MFKLNPNPTFNAKVQLSVPGQDKPVSVEIEYKHLSRPQIKKYFDGLEGKTDAEALSEIILGWKGIDAEYDSDTLQALLDNYPTSGGELFEAFRKELMEARRKN